MASERIQRRINQLLDEADGAVTAFDWDVVRARAGCLGLRSGKHITWDQVASSLDGRESAFELHASGGLTAWRSRLRTWFSSYNEWDLRRTKITRV